MAKVDILNYISDNNILRSTYDTDTNELDITDVPQNLNSVITLGQGSGGAEVEELNVTANGTYTAPEGKAYSPVNVNVSDNDAAFIMGTLSGLYENNEVTMVKGYGFYEQTSLTSISLPNVISCTNQSFGGCTNLTSLSLPKLTTLGGQYCFTNNTNLPLIVLPSFTSNIVNFAFYGCTALSTADLKAISLGGQAFGNTSISTLILRNNGVCACSANTFNGTPFANGGAGGEIYVPSSLISTYQTATNWSTYHSYGTITWKAIENSYYETHYADGTPIGA